MGEVVQQETVKRRLDWGCERCRRHGNIVVEFKLQDGKPVPVTDDETLHRKLFAAHHQGDTALIRCLQPTEYLLIGRLWYWVDKGQGRKQMIVIDMKDVPEDARREYRWPPWEV